MHTRSLATLRQTTVKDALRKGAALSSVSVRWGWRAPFWSSQSGRPVACAMSMQWGILTLNPYYFPCRSLNSMFLKPQQHLPGT